jgi:cytochrome d ubiquinol oxidase subunit I
MSAELLSRLQFALTVSFHFIYPPISMGLGLLLVVMAAMYVRTRDPLWRRSSFFWVRVYGLVFAMGIATGIVQEFEFGTNWSTYARYVGNIFGSLLAAEGIFAFFLEGGFLGLMLFGGDRLGPRMWLLATFLVVFGAHFSALWILMANSWMQTPRGFVVQETQWGSMAVMTSFAEVVTTPSFLPRLLHTWVASWMVGASLVLSVSAWYLLKRRHLAFARRNLTLALWVFAVLSVLQAVIFGANMAISVTNNQQVKLAAMEGVWQSEPCTPMFLMGWVDEAAQTTTGISIPCLLSILAYQDPQAVVTGLPAFPQDVWAPVNLTFQVYHLMIDLGGLFPLIGLAGLVALWWKRRVFTFRPLLWVFVGTIVLTELATLSGWWTAEIGRQPWVVWNQLRTADAVSPVLAGTQVLLSLVMFALLYALLFSLFLFLLNGKIQEGPAELEPADRPDSLPDTFREVFRHHPRASASGEPQLPVPAGAGQRTTQDA